MATSKHGHELRMCLEAYFPNLISMDDYITLHNYYKPDKWYARKQFSLNDLNDTFCIEFFRFNKHQLTVLATELNLLEVSKLRNGITFPAIEGLCILLACLSSPGKLTTLIKLFNQDKSAISRIFNFMIETVYFHFHHLLATINHPWLMHATLHLYSELVTDAGSPLPNITGFIDGVGVKICRPVRNQRNFYSGHHRAHVVKYQAVNLPNGIVLCLHGAFYGKVHDARMLALSKLSHEMIEFWQINGGHQFRLYGDKGYAHTPLICSPYRGNVSRAQELFNNKMSEHRVHAEYGFGRVYKLFPFVDYKKKKQVLLQPVNKVYQVAVILMNCHTCMRGFNQMSLMYDCDPPTLQQYLWK